MAIKVSLYGYPMDKATDLLAKIEMALTAADVDSEMFLEANMEAGDPRIKITLDKKSGIFAIAEQLFVHRVCENLEIAGAASLFFEAGDFMRDGWIKKLGKHRIPH